MTCQPQREQPRLLLSDPARQARRIAPRSEWASAAQGPIFWQIRNPRHWQGAPHLEHGLRVQEPRSKAGRKDDDDDDGVGTWEWSTEVVPERLSSRSNFAEVGQ